MTEPTHHGPPDEIRAPFTIGQVEHLLAWQQSGAVHPFTCGNRGDGKHGTIFGDTGALIPTVNGWICAFCDYKQNWAHAIMGDGQTMKKIGALMRARWSTGGKRNDR